MNSNRGFIALPLWAYAAVGAALLLAFGLVQTHRLRATKAEYSAFVADVRAKGEAQEKATQEAIKRDKQAKENADAQNARLRAANAALSASLRESRARGGILPPSPGNSGVACFDRAELERALQSLDAGVSKLLGEGDEARIGIDTIKQWARTQAQVRQ